VLGGCACMYEQILQLYPDERLKKQTLKLLFSKGYLIGERELCQQRLVATVLAFFFEVLPPRRTS